MQQQWQKRDVVFRPNGEHSWMQSHAQVPTPYRTKDDKLRIYFGTRDARNRTLTTFLEVNPQAPGEIRRPPETPVLPLGELGCFDDSGVMPGCVVTTGCSTYLYYCGWNTSTTVAYRLSIGMAVSDDDGQTFQRPFEGPILDRTPHEPYLCGAPCVLNDGGVWRMWYPSGTQWITVNGRTEPRYLIRYAESNDGFEWRRPGKIAINYERDDEALARPWVVKDGSIYRMWFSSRSIDGYRNNSRKSYRMGYAESSDGIVWNRMDELAGLHVADSGWDSEMLAYPAIFDLDCRRYIFYNGNGFGTSGFGFAEMEILQR